MAERFRREQFVARVGQCEVALVLAHRPGNPDGRTWLFDLPIVARRFAAVPETLDGAGLLLEADDGPAVFAEAMLEVQANASLRSTLVDAGRRRLHACNADDARAAWLERLGELS